MFWTIAQFPEFDHLDSSQRAAVLNRVPRWTYPTMVARSLVIGLALGGLIAGFVLNSSVMASEMEAAVIGFAVAGIAVWYYNLQLRQMRIDMRKVIAEGFRDRRPPFCFSCGYDLRISTTDCCPECGKPTAAPPLRHV
jgi:hypothetical protein